MVKLEEGKYYRTRDGRKVGPMVHLGDTMAAYNTEYSLGNYWWLDGRKNKNQIRESDLVAEWVETTSMDIYSLDKPFGWLNEVTQKALKDHYYDGGKLEIYTSDGWVTRSKGDGWGVGWYKALIHRAVKKPEVTEKTLYGNKDSFWYTWYNDDQGKPTHKITFNIVDGVPDCNSIRMEKL